jgi:hypothetical protein
VQRLHLQHEGHPHKTPCAITSATEQRTLRGSPLEQVLLLSDFTAPGHKTWYNGAKSCGLNLVPRSRFEIKPQANSSRHPKQPADTPGARYMLLLRTKRAQKIAIMPHNTHKRPTMNRHWHMILQQYYRIQTGTALDLLLCNCQMQARLHTPLLSTNQRNNMVLQQQHTPSALPQHLRFRPRADVSRTCHCRLLLMAHCTLFDRIYLPAMPVLCHACSLALSIRRPAPDDQG